VMGILGFLRLRPPNDPPRAGVSASADARPRAEEPRSGESLVSEHAVTTDAQQRPSLPSLVQLVGSIVAPVTLITALLYFFGWNRTNELYLQFGVDASMLRFSNQDYLTRSVEAIYVPLGALLVALILSLWAHGIVWSWLELRHRLGHLRRGTVVLVVVGLGLLARGVVGVLSPSLSSKDFLTTPLCLGAGTASVAYGRYLWRRLQSLRVKDHSTGEPPWLRTMSVSLVLMLIVLSVFWAATNYAQAYGRGRALQFADRLNSRPGVIIYTRNRLFLAAPGITEEELPRVGRAYRYRYTGLRLLIESGSRFFLLPTDWNPQNGSVIVLPDNDTVRLELVPGRG
jgi:hypothetical protein